MRRIDREQFNHPRYSYCVFQHTLTSLEDCLTILNETGSVEDAEEYQGNEDARYVQKIVDTCVEIAEYYGNLE